MKEFGLLKLTREWFGLLQTFFWRFDSPNCNIREYRDSSHCHKLYIPSAFYAFSNFFLHLFVFQSLHAAKFVFQRTWSYVVPLQLANLPWRFFKWFYLQRPLETEKGMFYITGVQAKLSTTIQKRVSIIESSRGGTTKRSTGDNQIASQGGCPSLAMTLRYWALNSDYLY